MLLREINQRLVTWIILKMSEIDPKKIKIHNRTVSRRIFLLGASKVFLVGGIVSYMLYKQKHYWSYYKVASDRNRIRIRFIKPERADILDREGNKIAQNRLVYQITIIPQNILKNKHNIKFLADIGNISITEVKERCNKQIKAGFGYNEVFFKSNLSWEMIKKLALNYLNLEGIYIRSNNVRYYPFKDKFAHVIGFATLPNVYDDSETVKRISRVPMGVIGRTGIEKSYDDTIIGKVGIEKLEVNVHNHIVRQISFDDPIKYDPIYTSLDMATQNELIEGFKNHKAGGGIVIDIKTGEIIALYSHPSFDHNIFSNLDQDKWKAFDNNPYGVFNNKVLNGLYAPGSAFKVVLMIAAMEKGIDLERFPAQFCDGKGFNSGSRKFHCWKKDGHGKLDCLHATEQSCDIFFYNLMLKLNIEDVYKTAKRLGLGVESDLDVGIGSKGILPNKEWKRRKYNKPWFLGDSLNLSIGQGFLLTSPLQLCKMMGIIAGRGKLADLRCVAPEGKMRWYGINISDDDWEFLHKALALVVTGKKGTARSVKIGNDYLEMAGKTGTSQVRNISKEERKEGVIKNKDLEWNFRDNSVFTGFAPFYNPRFASSVIIEHGGGGSKAAKIVSKALKAAQKSIML